MIRQLGELIFLAFVALMFVIAIALFVDWISEPACASAYTDMDAARSAQRECLSSGGVAVVRGTDEVTIGCEQ